ncbi:hypothetical protein HanRHA438_Chr13g0595491 [Helianthus annuus]|nr:hypothetical protein HanRHA438_Chr13g0595491 [Helianthus annuus]
MVQTIITLSKKESNGLKLIIWGLMDSGGGTWWTDLMVVVVGIRWWWWWAWIPGLKFGTLICEGG